LKNIFRFENDGQAALKSVHFILSVGNFSGI